MASGEGLVVEMRNAGIRALRFFPNDHRYFLDELSWGDQMPVFAERRIPLFIKARVDAIGDLLRAFPTLTVITGTHGFNPLDRYAWPLVERFSNLHFETSSYLTDGAIEEFCEVFGAHRLVFGSGYPENARGAALFRLARAGISEEQRSQISSGNLERLLGEVDLS
jgi:predicted TIM-barrel fold metal-dependent hydrolase